MQNATTTTTTASSYNLQRRSVVSPAVFPHLLRLITNPNQKERYTRTRLLSCLCLVAIYNTCPSCFLNVGTKSSLSTTLLELLNDPGQSGDDAALCLSSLLAEKEDLQQLAYEANAVKTIVDILKSECELQPKRLQGLFQSLAELSSKLEDCRCTFLSLQVLLPSLSSLVLVFLYSYLISCICFRITSRSIKNLSAGLFTKDHVMLPLVQLLHDPSPSVLVHSRISLILGALSNITLNLKNSFIQTSKLKDLLVLSVILSLWYKSKLWPFFVILLMDVSTPLDEDGLILDTVGRQLRKAPQAQIAIQGMYVLTNVSSGTELHKEAVMQQLFPQGEAESDSFMVKSFAELREPVTLKSMVIDPCLDV
ncbi:BnaC03g78040D [Brassica napus]|uniref:BnaC03g78040D protein n=1 Tax=Brassica napus TaxID=3708 RepID=A0A078JVU7_BRANA|nr:BnaC03g78040D [Brassica napus]